MDNIVIKKIWEDNDFYQIQIFFISQNVTMKTITYTVEKEIEDLSVEITNYLNNQSKKVNWKIGDKKSSDSPVIKINSVNTNKNGYVLLNVFCDVISDFETEEYFCKFPIVTESGLLYDFAKNILTLNNSKVGKIVKLNPICTMGEDFFL